MGMTHQFLNDPDVNPVFEQVGGKTMAKGTAADRFCDSRLIYRRPYCLLEPGFKHMMASRLT